MSNDRPVGTGPRWRRTLIVSGILLVALSIVADEIGISAGEGIGYGQVFVAAAGAMMVLAGILGPKFPSAYRTTAIILMNTLLLFALLEFGALITIKIFRLDMSEHTSRRELIQQRDIEAKGVMFPSQLYAPFVMWRSEPVSFPDFRIDSSGVRFTPGVSDAHERIHIFALGGSAMWGWMVHDSSTVPAHLQSSITRSCSQEVEVVNMAENGYVSTQELVGLILQLGSGNVPDVVVFYNGLNDILAAYENGSAGLLIGNARAAFRTQGSGLNGPTRLSFDRIILSTNVGQLLSRLITGDAVPEREETTVLVCGHASLDDPDFDMNGLADEVCDHYVGNLMVVDALSSSFGFEYYCFLQPVLSLSGKELTESERELLDAEERILVELVALVYSRLEECLSGNEAFHPILDLFDRCSDPVFTDLCHMNPAGNRMVADYMAEVILASSGLFDEEFGIPGTSDTGDGNGTDRTASEAQQGPI